MGQFTVQQLIDQSLANIPDNNQNLITAAKLREVLTSFASSLADIYQKIQFDYYDSGKIYQNNDITFYQDVLYKKTNGSGTGITPSPSINWSVLTENPFANQGFFGFTRFATPAEVLAGTSETLAISPATLPEAGNTYTGTNGINVDNGTDEISFDGGFVNIPNLTLDVEGDLIIQEDGVTPTNGKILIQDSGKLKFFNKPTEFSYNFGTNQTLFNDIWIRANRITEISKSVGIDKVFVSTNGGLFLDVIPSLPLNFVANGTMIIKVTYNVGYNTGVVAFKGEILG